MKARTRFVWVRAFTCWLGPWPDDEPPAKPSLTHIGTWRPWPRGTSMVRALRGAPDRLRNIFRAEAEARTGARTRALAIKRARAMGA